MSRRTSAALPPPPPRGNVAGATPAQRAETTNRNWRAHSAWKQALGKSHIESALDNAHDGRAQWDQLHEPGQPWILHHKFTEFLDRVLRREGHRKRAFAEVVSRLHDERPDLLVLLRAVVIDERSYSEVARTLGVHRTTVMRNCKFAVALLERWYDEIGPPALREDR